MKILRLTIENLNSLRLKKTIEFDQPPLNNVGLFAITGDTGAGKTTILDAITLALYGRIHRNDKPEEVMSYGAAESLAEVEFETHGGLFRAKWTLRRAYGKPEGALQPSRRELSQWDEEKDAFVIIAEKKREIDDRIEEVSGLDYDRFSRSVMLSQGDFAAFLKSGERERSDLLERITGTEVYSQLSQAAYRRYKLEEEKLLEMRRALDALQVLQPEQLKTIKNDRQASEEKAEQLKQQLAETRTALDWLEQIRRLQERQEELQQRQTENEAERTAARDDLERLARHRQSRPLHASLARFDDLEERRQQRLSEVEVLTAKAETLGKEREEARQQHLVLTETLAGLRQEKKEKDPVFDQVITLDTRIREKQEPLQKIKEELDAFREELKSSRKKLTAVREEKKALEEQQKTLQNWLDQHPVLANLAEDYPQIKAQANDMRELLRNQQQLTRDRKATAKELEKAEHDLSATDRTLQTRKEELESLVFSFKERLPERYSIDRGELLDRLLADIERLSEQKKNLEQLNSLAEEYEKMLVELSAYEENLDALQHEELEVSKEVMNSMETLDQASQRLEYRQEVYRQQQLIANYEKDRTTLKEGEPCPLCFSKDHPFRKEPVKPFVDEARRELTVAEKWFDQARQDHRRLLNRQFELSQSIEQLKGTEIELLSGQLGRQQERILEYEGRIAKVAPDLAREDFALSRGAVLRQKLEEFSHNIDQKRQLRKELTELNRKLDNQEQQVQQLRQTFHEQEMEVRRLEDKVKFYQDQLDQLKERFQESEKEMNKLLAPYQLEFSVDTARSLLSQLEQDRKAYGDKKAALGDVLERLRDRTGESTRLEETVEFNTGKVTRGEIIWKEGEEALELLRGKRQALFSELDPQQERRQLEERIDAAVAELDRRHQQWQAIERQLESTRHVSEEKSKEARELADRLEALRHTLEAGAGKLGFPSLEDLRKAILTAEEEDRLAQLDKALDQRALEIRQSLRDVAGELEQLQLLQRTTEPEERLKGRLQEEEEALNEVQRALGALYQQLEDHKKKKKEAKILLEQIEQQKLEFNRWAKLNELIGSADGKKFRTFAQGLTLQRLTQLANQHLIRLNGRYLIEKSSDEDLELEIIDTFQADNRRSMNTLSGGESFLVSLALALGLSDLAGRRSQIRSLFIDEGFGTLDDNSLDLAISTLENLQAAGKTIGIISHVKELKERIGTQIQVKKKGSGFSDIEITG